MKKILAMLLVAMLALSCVAALAEGELVGVSMPTKDLQRWNQDGAYMEEKLKEAGYEVELQFASNDVPTQLNLPGRRYRRHRRLLPGHRPGQGC